MQINPDPELQAKAIEALIAEYEMDKQRPGLHQSELSYCLTRSYWDRTDPEPPTEKEVLLFSIGFGMERVIFDREHETAIEVDGITLSLDSIKQFGGGIDLKTTRMAARGRKGEDGFQWPEGWKRQMAAYAYGLNRIAAETCICGFRKIDHTLVFGPSHSSITCACIDWSPQPPSFAFGVIVIHLIEPSATAWRIVFEPGELEENWAWLLTRRDQLDSMLAGRNPMPFSSNEEWECKNCRYLMRCQLQASIDELSPISH